MNDRVTVTRAEAAEMLGVSLRHFERHIQPHIRLVYSGRLRLILRADLAEWAEREACVGGRAA